MSDRRYRVTTVLLMVSVFGAQLETVTQALEQESHAEDFAAVKLQAALSQPRVLEGMDILTASALLKRGSIPTSPPKKAASCYVPSS
jgi:hypothetical protein